MREASHDTVVSEVKQALILSSVLGVFCGEPCYKKVSR